MTAAAEEEGEWTDGRRVCIIRPFKTTMINEGDKARGGGRKEGRRLDSGTLVSGELSTAEVMSED